MRMCTAGVRRRARPGLCRSPALSTAGTGAHLPSGGKRHILEYRGVCWQSTLRLSHARPRNWAAQRAKGRAGLSCSHNNWPAHLHVLCTRRCGGVCGQRRCVLAAAACCAAAQHTPCSAAPRVVRSPTHPPARNLVCLLGLARCRSREGLDRRTGAAAQGGSGCAGVAGCVWARWAWQGRSPAAVLRRAGWLALGVASGKAGGAVGGWQPGLIPVGLTMAARPRARAAAARRPRGRSLSRRRATRAWPRARRGGAPHSSLSRTRQARRGRPSIGSREGRARGRAGRAWRGRT